MLVLAVQVHQDGAQRPQIRQRRERAAQEGASLSLRQDIPPRHDRAGFDRIAALLKERARRPVRGDIELRLDRGALGARPNHLGAAPAAQDESQRVHEDRLPGSRFPGQQVESRPQVERQVANDCQIGNVQAAEHRTRRVEGAVARGSDQSRMLSDRSRVVKEGTVC